MPCGSGDDYYRNDPEIYRRMDHLTRLLCSSCALLERHVVAMPDDLAFWWTRHKLADQKRLDRESRAAVEWQKRKSRDAYLQSIKTRLIQQLSDDEREALGLK